MNPAVQSADPLEGAIRRALTYEPVGDGRGMKYSWSETQADQQSNENSIAQDCGCTR